MRTNSKGFGGRRPQSPFSMSEVAWTVYLLRCNDRTIYTGCTKYLFNRLKRRAHGYVHYTSSRLPVRLETYVVCSDRYKEYDFERYLKSGSGKAFMRKWLV